MVGVVERWWVVRGTDRPVWRLAAGITTSWDKWSWVSLPHKFSRYTTWFTLSQRLNTTLAAAVSPRSMILCTADRNTGVSPVFLNVLVSHMGVSKVTMISLVLMGAFSCDSVETSLKPWKRFWKPSVTSTKACHTRLRDVQEYTGPVFLNASVSDKDYFSKAVGMIIRVFMTVFFEKVKNIC